MSNNSYLIKILTYFPESKYITWYNNIIQHAINRKFTSKLNANKELGYVERHHILPKSLCMDDNEINDIQNKILLTAKEHFIVHHLLVKANAFDSLHRKKLQYALSCFCRAKDRRKLTAIHYEISRIAAVVANRGKKKSKHSIELSASKQRGKTSFYDKDGNRFYLDVNDPIIKELELFGNRRNFTSVTDKDGNTFSVHLTHPKLLSGEYMGVRKGIATYIDNNGKKYNISPTDPLILKLKLKHINTGNRFKINNGRSKGSKNNMYGRVNEVCCFDLQCNKFVRIQKSIFLENKDRYVGPNNKVAKAFRLAKKTDIN